MANTKVYNNIIAGTRTAIIDYAEGAGSVNDHGLKNTLILNNTIIMPLDAFPNTGGVFGIKLRDNVTPSGTNRNVGSVIANNAVYGFNDDLIMYSEQSGALQGITLSNNLYFSLAAKPFAVGYDSSFKTTDFAGWKASVGAETGSQFKDPMLENVARLHGTRAACMHIRRPSQRWDRR
ncbi:MAG: hypothetical protein HC933_05080 [Pleurocapsa sp. SU_196_0]|nr:hypothetical protein [Pleurocapsa sp. SU_196_0]